MGVNTNFKIEGLNEEESNYLFGYIGNSNTSGIKFGKIYARDRTNIICGYETYTIKEFLSKKNEIIKEYKNESNNDVKSLKLAIQILEKIFDKNKKITIDWG